MTSIASLWFSSSLWEGIEYTAEALVVICALIEVLAECGHILKGDENKTLRKSVEKRAAIGLVVGLAVSLGALVRTNGLFTDTIASAYREARDAGDRATDANGKAKIASDKATLAQDRADKAETQAGIAIKQAGVLYKQAEDERMARVTLEEKVAWRSLDETHQIKFGSRLKTFVRQIADCEYLAGDMEAFSFSSDVASALRMAGWRAIPPSSSVLTMRETSLPTSASPIEKLETGVEVKSTGDPGSVSAARAVVEQLHRLGFDAEYKPSIERSADARVWVLVEHRPLGAQGDAKLRATSK